MVLHDVKSWGLFAERLDDNAWASANLARFAFFVDLAQSWPFAQLLAGVDADQRDLMFAAQGGDELLILRFIAAFSQNAEHGLTSKKGNNVIDFCLVFIKSDRKRYRFVSKGGIDYD